jgi:hypothetical protein
MSHYPYCAYYVVQEGRSSLMLAVDGGHVEVVKQFLKLDYQCDTNIQEKVSHAHDYQIECAYQ